MFRALIVLIFIASLGISQGQSYIPLLDENSLWSTIRTIVTGEKQTFFHQFAGDTIIDSTHYKHIYSSQDSNHMVWDRIGFIREDTLQQRVYFRFLNDSIDRLLYDFSLQVGDSAKICNLYIPNGSMYHVISTDSVLIDGQWRKRINYGLEQWIEGIGSGRGVLFPAYFIVGWYVELLCFYNNSMLLWSSPNWSDCYIVETEEVESVSLQVYPNPAQDFLNISGFCEHPGWYAILTAEGCSIMKGHFTPTHNTRIDISHLPAGIYLLHIEDVAGKIMSRKVVVQR